MAKFQITVEDTADGVSIQLDNQNQVSDSKAGRLANALMKASPLIIGRIPFGYPDAHAAYAGCDCEICQAMQEKLLTKPTIH